ACAAVGPSGRVLLIEGDAGIGKSRLVDEALGAARLRSFPALLGHAHDGVSAPYAPIVSALRRLLRQVDPAEQAALFSGSARLAWGLLSELRHNDVEPVQVTPADVGAALVEGLLRVANGSPITLAIEDLQWADIDSLLLLAAVARELHDTPLWLVLTSRRGEGPSPTAVDDLVADLRRQRDLDVVTLRPLDTAAVRQM